MDAKGRNNHQKGLACFSALFLLAVSFSVTALAIPVPRPYSVERRVENWSYNAGEAIVVNLRIITDTRVTGEEIRIPEVFSLPAEKLQFEVQPDQFNVVFEPDGATLLCRIMLDERFTSPFEFQYMVWIAEDVTGMVRITAMPELLPEPALFDNLVTDLYPPGLPNFTNADDDAINNYINQLKQQAEDEGWEFDVDNNGILNRPHGTLLGTNEDFLPVAGTRKMMTFPKVSPKAPLPTRWDWRESGPAVPIGDQGNCGSCWAFSLVSIAERLVAIKDGVQVKFSEQWVLDCNDQNWNCLGGWNPYQMFIDKDKCGVQGLVLEAVLPYQEIKRDCNCGNYRTSPYSFSYVGSIDESLPPADKVNAIKQAIYDNGPVWTTVHAGHAPFLAYVSGVFNVTPSSPTIKIDHAVVIEGWDDTLGGGVWIMRNSWGTSWGDDGYMYIKYNTSLIGSYTDVVSYVGSSNGNITVTLGPQAAIDAGAQWRVDDGIWLGSGVTLPNLVPGEYTLSYKAITGFTKPEDETVQVGEKENVTRTGTYVTTTGGEGEDDLPATLLEIAELFLQEFNALDESNDGRLSYAEIIDVFSDLTPTQFSTLDTDGNGFLTREELQAYIDGTGNPSCCGTCSKSGSWDERVKRHMGDWMLVGLTLLTLMYVAEQRKTR